jgi:hypothetical protein
MDDTEKKRKEDIQWHQAFYTAIQGHLIEYSDVLEYKLEHPLNIKPLLIDMLVIKKRPDAVIKKQIAEIFRRDNIFEYKSPSVSLSVNEFHKAFARANLYKALSPDVEIADLTLSFVISTHPRELLRHLREALGCVVEERHPGLHVVTGAMLPIQIINITKLPEDDNLWLQNLNRNLSREKIRRIRQLERRYGKQIDLGAYLYMVLTANQDKLSKEDYVMLNRRTLKIFEELGWAEQWRQKAILEGREKGRLEGIDKGRLEGIEKGIEKGKLETARALFAEGFTLEKISRLTGLPLKTLKEKLTIK